MPQMAVTMMRETKCADSLQPCRAWLTGMMSSKGGALSQCLNDRSWASGTFTLIN